MYVQLLAQYSLNGPLTHLVARSGGRAVCLSNWGRTIILLANGAVYRMELSETPHQSANWPDHWPAREEECEFFLPRVENYGALFAYGNGVGVIYSDRVHLWEDLEEPLKHLPITNPLPPDPEFDYRKRAVVVASPIPGKQQLVAIVSDFFCAQYGITLARLTLDVESATWNEQLHELDFGAIESIITSDPQLDYSPGEVWWSQQIGSILAINAQETLVNATRGFTLAGSPAFCGYCTLGKVGATLQLELLRVLPVGRALFASDQTTLLVRSLPPQETPQLYFYNLQGALLDTLLLTNDVLGAVYPLEMVFDMNGNDLWLVDTRMGNVSHCRLI